MAVARDRRGDDSQGNGSASHPPIVAQEPLQPYSAMLTHIVCFKYRPEVAPEARADHRRKLQGLARLNGVLHLETGADVVGSARSYDTGLVITFAGRGALDRYQSDPLHVPVAQLGAELCSSIVAVDFES